MTQEIAGLSVNDRLFVPLFNENATIAGFRYYTSRNNGRTSMVADYITDSGKASFDGIERVREWKVGSAPNANLIAAAPELLEALKALAIAKYKGPQFMTEGLWEQAYAAIAKAEGK